MRRRHHTVPQMYLRFFADEAEQVRLVSRHDPSRSHRSALHNAVTEAGFYRIEVAELAREEDRATFDPESVEEGLSGLEGAAKPTLMKLVSSGLTHFEDADWYRLYQFVALQTVRGNRWRSQLKAALTRPIRDHYVATGLISGAEKFPLVVPPKAMLVQESLKMALGTGEDGDMGLLRFLADKNVRLIRPGDTAVLTSDEPVCWWAPGEEEPGYAHAAVVWLPLTPRLIVQFRARSFDAAAGGLPTGDDELAAFINGRVASQAERWIVHHPADTPLAGVTLAPSSDTPSAG